MISAIGYIAGACTILSMLPQITKVYRTKRADDLSMGMFALLFIGALLWGLYGVLLEEVPIVLFNSAYLMLVGYQIVLKRRYKVRKCDGRRCVSCHSRTYAICPDGGLK